VTCAPGTLTGGGFPVGATPVQCAAQDPAGNRATGGFTVTVAGAAEQLSALRAAVQGMGPGTALADKAAAAQAALAAGDRAGACGTLGDFLNLVQAQAGKAIPPATAAALGADAARVQTALGCA